MRLAVLADIECADVPFRVLGGHVAGVADVALALAGGSILTSVFQASRFAGVEAIAGHASPARLVSMHDFASIRALCNPGPNAGRREIAIRLLFKRRVYAAWRTRRW